MLGLAPLSRFWRLATNAFERRRIGLLIYELRISGTGTMPPKKPSKR
jgi:hypothetical protein